MTGRTALRWAWSLCALSFLVLGAAVWFFVVNVPTTGFNVALVPIQFGSTVAYAPLGALLASKRPKNLVGWILIGYGLFSAVSVLMGQYELRAFVTAPNSLPAATFVAWLHPPLEEFTIFFFPALFLFLFPTGHPPSRRWQPFTWVLVAVALVEAVAYMLQPGELTGTNQGARIQAYDFMPNPTGITGLPLFLQVPTVVFLGLVVAVVPSLGSLLWRLRRSLPDERQQVKWLAYIAALFVLLAFPLYSPFFPKSGLPPNLLYELSTLIVIFGFPAAATTAILKYRLYDIDIVANKSLIFGTLAVFITGVYVLVVAGLGSVLGSSGRPNLVLSILATAIVAVVFQPVRKRVERLANRLVYGQRATPYEVLAQFTERVAGTYGSEETLARMARLLADATGASRADVWLRLGERIAPAASWPKTHGPHPQGLALAGQRLPPIDGVTQVVAVHHQGELLGALSVKKRPGETLKPVEESLLKDLAAQAGLVLRNVRLTGELRERLGQIFEQANELVASRQRIVAAQDDERRRLERNIHDGAQQHLVALTVKLRLAASQARQDPQRALNTVRALDAETDDALTTLRDLARGIYPPVLREQGLVGALRGQISRMDLPAEISGDGVARYAPEIEAAVYFSCLEALQNASKHAGARHVSLAFEERDGCLNFVVVDDGRGFDPGAVGQGSGLQNMADRLAALGGTLGISATPGGGTAVTGRLPLDQFAFAAAQAETSRSGSNFDLGM